VQTISQGGNRTVMAQRYIPAITEGDKRVLLIDGQVVPHCLAPISCKSFMSREKTHFERPR